MSKIDLSRKYKNLFYWPYEMSSNRRPAGPLYNYQDALSRGWNKGDFSTENEINNDMPYWSADGYATRYTGAGDGAEVYLYQPFPASVSTTYRVSVWCKVHSYVNAADLNQANAFNLVLGPDCGDRLVKKLNDDAKNFKWSKHEIIWTSPATTNGCWFRGVFFCEDMLAGTSMWVWGAELNVLQPGPNFFADWPEFINQLTY